VKWKRSITVSFMGTCHKEVVMWRKAEMLVKQIDAVKRWN